MRRGDRERWNKLSDGAKAVMRAVYRFRDAGRVSLNDLRMNANLRGCGSTEIMAYLREMESRGFGVVRAADDVDPEFVMDLATFESLAQTHRITDQAPHKPT